MKLKPPKAAAYSILPAAGVAEVDALDPEGQLGELVRCQRDLEVPGEERDERDDHGRGAPETGAGRRVRVEENLPIAIGPVEPLEGGLDEVELPVVDEILGRPVPLRPRRNPGIAPGLVPCPDAS